MSIDDVSSGGDWLSGRYLHVATMLWWHRLPCEGKMVIEAISDGAKMIYILVDPTTISREVVMRQM